jgi:hypothetical protein
MYKTVNNDVVSSLFKRIVSASENHNNKNNTSGNKKKLYYLGCLGKHHKLNYFNISECTSHELLFRNDNSDSFKITLRCYKISFDVILYRKNNYFQFCTSTHDKNMNDYNIVRGDDYVFGITVADIIKYYYNCNHLCNQLQNDETNTHDSEIEMSGTTETTVTTKIFNNFIKNALKHESVFHDCKNIFGVMNSDNYISYNVWDEKYMDSFIRKKNNNIYDFLNKNVFFQEQAMYNTIKQNTKMNAFCENLDKLFSTCITKEHIYELFKNFYNKDAVEDDNKYIYTYIFEHPLSIPDALYQVYQQTKDEKYMFYYNKLAKINNNESFLLNEKHKKYVVNSLKDVKITFNFPFFGLKNIYVNIFDISDMDQIKEIYRDYKARKRSYKIKHDDKKSGKAIAYKYERLYGRTEVWTYAFLTGKQKIRQCLTDDINDQVESFYFQLPHDHDCDYSEYV